MIYWGLQIAWFNKFACNRDIFRKCSVIHWEKVKITNEFSKEVCRYIS